MTQTQYIGHAQRTADRMTREALGDAEYEARAADVAADNAAFDAEIATADHCTVCDGCGMDENGDDCADCNGTGGWK